MGYSVELKKIGIDLKGRTSGQIKTKCFSGKHEGTNDMSVNIDDGTYHCFSPKCGVKGCVRPNINKKTYVLPEWKNTTGLEERFVQYLAARGLSQDTLNKMGVVSKGDWMQFPHTRNGVVINVQARTMDKQFKMYPGAELIFYNIDSLYANEKIIIVEGAMDALSYIESGVDNVISVPNGANVGQMEYLTSVWERIEQLKEVYLSVDNDEPGLLLQKELARRIGCEKCYIINLHDCKDANEYLVKYGKEALKQAYEEATPYPLEGIVYVADVAEDVRAMYRDGLKQGATTGEDAIDDYISFEPGYVTIITGLPNFGKTEALDMLMVWLNMNAGWDFGIWSAENFPVAGHVSRLLSKINGMPFFGFNKMTESQMLDTEEYVNQHYFFINAEKAKSIDDILEQARLLVLRYGIKGLIIDPYNMMDNGPAGDGKDPNVAIVLKACRVFARKYGVHIFVVAHPRKMGKGGDGKYLTPTLYDVNGSADWYSMTDIGICVHRDGQTQIHIQKRRFKHWGRKAIEEAILLTYNDSNGRFYHGEPDNTNWLNGYGKRKSKQNELPI